MHSISHDMIFQKLYNRKYVVCPFLTSWVEKHNAFHIVTIITSHYTRNSINLLKPEYPLSFPLTYTVRQGTRLADLIGYANRLIDIFYSEILEIKSKFLLQSKF